jgi:hypothetical protein
MNFVILCKHFGTVTQCSVNPTVPVLFTEKPLRYLIFGRNLRKISICFGNRPLTYFFHDQTIFLKDCVFYTIGHSLQWKAQQPLPWKSCVWISNILVLFLHIMDKISNIGLWNNLDVNSLKLTKFLTTYTRSIFLLL